MAREGEEGVVRLYCNFWYRDMDYVNDVGGDAVTLAMLAMLAMMLVGIGTGIGIVACVNMLEVCICIAQE